MNFRIVFHPVIEAGALGENPEVAGAGQVITDTGVATVEDPATFDPHAITDRGPGVLRHCTPCASVVRRVAVDLHHTPVFPFNLHMFAVTDRALSAVGAGFL